MTTATATVCVLSEKQISILQWIADGKRNSDIAQLVGLGRPQNVQQQLQRIMEATGTASRAAAVAYAMRHQLIK